MRFWCVCLCKSTCCCLHRCRSCFCVQRDATFSDSGNVIYFGYSLFLKRTEIKNTIANNQRKTHTHKQQNVECRFGYFSVLACFHLLSLFIRSIAYWIVPFLPEHSPKSRSTSLIISFFFWKHSFKLIIKCLENWYHQNTIIVFAVHFPLWSHFAVLSTL